MLQSPPMGSLQEQQPIQKEPGVDDMTDEQLGEILGKSIESSDRVMKTSLEDDVIRDIKKLVINVWRKKEFEEIKELVANLEPEGSKTDVEILTERYDEALDKGQPKRETVDRLKGYVVERLAPTEVPKLPMTKRYYITSAMDVLVRRKRAEGTTTLPQSRLSQYL